MDSNAMDDLVSAVEWARDTMMVESGQELPQGWRPSSGDGEFCIGDTPDARYGAQVHRERAGVWIWHAWVRLEDGEEVSIRAAATFALSAMQRAEVWLRNNRVQL